LSVCVADKIKPTRKLNNGVQLKTNNIRNMHRKLQLKAIKKQKKKNELEDFAVFIEIVVTSRI